MIEGTVFIHLCEVRQGINTYGMSRVSTLLQKWKRCKSLVRDHLEYLHRTGGNSSCFFVQVLDFIANQGITLSKHQRRSGRRPLSACQLLKAAVPVSPKLTLGGIPEWCALRHAFEIVVARLPGAGLKAIIRAGRRVGVPKAVQGTRKTKVTLRRQVAAASARSPNLRPPQSARALEAVCRKRGINPVPRQNGKRRRLSVQEMTRALEVGSD